MNSDEGCVRARTRLRRVRRACDMICGSYIAVRPAAIPWTAASNGRYRAVLYMYSTVWYHTVD